MRFPRFARNDVYGMSLRVYGVDVAIFYANIMNLIHSSFRKMIIFAWF